MEAGEEQPEFYWQDKKEGPVDKDRKRNDENKMKAMVLQKEKNADMLGAHLRYKSVAQT